MEETAWSWDPPVVDSLRSTSSISSCARKALCFGVRISGSSGGIALTISLRGSSVSAKRVVTAGVSCLSNHSPLVVVTEEYSDLFLRTGRVRPLFSAINSLSPTWLRSLTGTELREPSTMDRGGHGLLGVCRLDHWGVQFSPLSYGPTVVSNRRVPQWYPSHGYTGPLLLLQGRFL